MDKDRISGSIKQISGAIRQTIGKVLGDRKFETEGKIERAEGSAQNAAGGLKDTAREVARGK